MSNTPTAPRDDSEELRYYGGEQGGVGQYVAWPQQIPRFSTSDDHVVRENDLHNSNNTGAPVDTYALSSSSTGVNNLMLPPNLVHSHTGRPEGSQSKHPVVHYSSIYGDSFPGTMRGPQVSILTNHPPNQVMGFPQHQARGIRRDGSGNASPSTSHGSYENGQTPRQDSQLQMWSFGSAPTSPVRPRSTSPSKTVPPRTRNRGPRPQHSQYLDSLLRSKYPEERQYALDLAIKFREEHGSSDPIPNDIIDELLEGPKDGKYYCFCCPRARKLRTIAQARDHVRKSLGIFPFKCPNWWCQHTSLRQADLTKHMKTCVNISSQ